MQCGRDMSEIAFDLCSLWVRTHWRKIMLYWALMFLLVALIAGVLGFSGLAVAAAGVSKVLFVIFLVLFLVSLVAHIGAGRRSTY
jgi:uncharacterized membrane protein YtjA (UPF0391 family)